MASYTYQQLMGTGSIGENLSGLETFTFTNPSGSSYLTLETITTSSFYNASSPTNFVGVYSASASMGLVTSSYISAVVVPPGSSVFTFTPTSAVTGTTYYLKGTGMYSLVISHGSSSPSLPFQFTVTTNNAGTSSSNQFRLPLTNTGSVNMQVFWGDGTSSTITTYNQAEVTHTYASIGTYTINISGSVNGWKFDGGGDGRKMIDISRWGTFVMNTDSAFANCQVMTVTATDAPTITTTDIHRCFYYCFSFNGAIENWDVSGVRDMEAMFVACVAFNQPLNAWNVGNVINMKDMFNTCNTFNQPLNTWDVSSVTDMSGMFYNIEAFDQNLGSWDVSNVTNFDNFLEGKTPSTFSSTNLDAIYNGWSQLSVKPNLTIRFGTAKYTLAGFGGRDILTGVPNSWTIFDGGL